MTQIYPTPATQGAVAAATVLVQCWGPVFVEGRCPSLAGLADDGPERESGLCFGAALIVDGHKPSEAL